MKQESAESIEQIEKYVSGIKKWFDMEVEDDSIRLSTREHGDVCEEEVGEEDVQLAREIIKDVSKKFDNVKCEWEDVDEWVDVTIRINK